MNKEEFLNELRKKLSGLPQDDLNERIAFYSEMIDDRMEDGLTEEEAVDGIGSVDSIVEQIMSDIPLTKLVKDKIKPKRELKAWEIVLLVLGAPAWVPLFITLISVVLSIYISIWSVVISLYAVDISLMAGAAAGIAGIVTYALAGNTAGILFSVGAGLICVGLTILLLIACIWITIGIIKLTKKIILGIKRMIVGKEKEDE